MRIFAWIVLGAVLLAMLALALYLIVGQIIFKMTFSKRKKSGRLSKKNIDKQLKDFNVDLCWWDKVKFETVSIFNSEKMKLVGHFFDNNSDKTVVILHGYGGTYVEMQPYCEFFKSKNFNILVVDNRAHGDSEGKCIGFGWYDRLDVLDWIQYLNQRQNDSKILLFGISMGATAVCCASGEKLPENVVAVISDCAFANGEKQIYQVVKSKFKIARFIVKFFKGFLKRTYAFDLSQVDAVRQVKMTKVPILYIHGQADNFVPVQNLYDLYNATPEGLRDKFVVEGAGHAQSYMTAGVLYERKINSFLASRTRL